MKPTLLVDVSQWEWEIKNVCVRIASILFAKYILKLLSLVLKFQQKPESFILAMLEKWKKFKAQDLRVQSFIKVYNFTTVHNLLATHYVRTYKW